MKGMVMNEDEAREQHIAACRAKVAEHGHMVAAIGADPDGGDPQFAYTIGLTTLCGYEFVISGLPIEDMHNALNALARKARDGVFKPSDNLLVEGVFQPPYLPRLRPVDPARLGEFGWITPVLDLPEAPPMWQAQYSTRDHKYPGDPGYGFNGTYQLDYSQPEAV